MSKQIRNKDGSMSLYGLHCGYVDEYLTNKYRAQLYHEGAVYSVRWFEYETGFQPILRNWLNFENLKDARKVFKLVKKYLKKDQFMTEYGALYMAGLTKQDNQKCNTIYSKPKN